MALLCEGKCSCPLSSLYLSIFIALACLTNSYSFFSIPSYLDIRRVGCGCKLEESMESAVGFIHSLSWPARELGWVKYEEAEYCFVCIVLFALHPFIQPSLLISFVCFKFLSTFTGLSGSSKIVSTVGLTS